MAEREGPPSPPLSKLFKYNKPLPNKGEETLNWLLDINEEFFKQELASVVSTLFSLFLTIYNDFFFFFFNSNFLGELMYS